jgi:hypothetical protein
MASTRPRRVQDFPSPNLSPQEPFPTKHLHGGERDQTSGQLALCFANQRKRIPMNQEAAALPTPSPRQCIWRLRKPPSGERVGVRGRHLARTLQECPSPNLSPQEPFPAKHLHGGERDQTSGHHWMPDSIPGRPQGQSFTSWRKSESWVHSAHLFSSEVRMCKA